MKSSKIIEVIDLVNLDSKKSREAIWLKGFIVSSDLVEIIDNPENPRIAINVIDWTWQTLLDKFPLRMRVGGRYMFEDQVKVQGILKKMDTVWTISEIQQIQFLSDGELVQLNSE